jgi:hypothetical protein
MPESLRDLAIQWRCGELRAAALVHINVHEGG